MGYHGNRLAKKSIITGKLFILKVLWMCKVLSKSVRSHFANLRKNPQFFLTTALNSLTISILVYTGNVIFWLFVLSKSFNYTNNYLLLCTHLFYLHLGDQHLADAFFMESYRAYIMIIRWPTSRDNLFCLRGVSY